MNKKYSKAYTEVLEILKHIPKDEYDRIPKSEIQFYENNCDKNYKFIYNESVSLKNQEISREANAVIIAIYMNYLADEKQKIIIDEVLKQNAVNAEKEKSKKYNSNNIFNNQINENSNLPMEVDKKKENIFVKFFNKLKHLFLKQSN